MSISSEFSQSDWLSMKMLECRLVWCDGGERVVIFRVLGGWVFREPTDDDGIPTSVFIPKPPNLEFTNE
jgi:hypothetical protein